MQVCDKICFNDASFRFSFEADSDVTLQSLTFVKATEKNKSSAWLSSESRFVNGYVVFGCRNRNKQKQEQKQNHKQTSRKTKEAARFCIYTGLAPTRQFHLESGIKAWTGLAEGSSVMALPCPREYPSTRVPEYPSTRTSAALALYLGQKSVFGSARGLERKKKTRTRTRR